MSNANDTRARAARLRLMAFDVDGVMTDGGLTYADDGSESKTFNVRDGLGLKLLQDGGIEVAVITGRQSPCVAARLRHRRCQRLPSSCPCLSRSSSGRRSCRIDTQSE